jgi:TolB-like protein
MVDRMLFEIGAYTIDTSRFAIRRGDEPVAVEPQVFDLLVLLIRERDRLVTKDEIFEIIWKRRAVSDAALSSRVKAARKALGDDGKSQRLIRTLHGRGFQFIGAVAEREATVRPAPAAPLVREPRCKVAVLPLRNIGGGPRIDMLALGIIEDVTTYLARMPGFLVISPYSTLRLADAGPNEASERLSVRYIVDGSVTATDERARVSIRLIDAEAAAHVWGEEIERGLEELSDLSRRFAREILRRLEPELTRIELAKLSGRLPESLDAWSLFRRAQGTLVFKPWTGATFAEVAELLEEAVGREERFALGHALYALCEALRHMAGFADCDASRDRVLKSAEAALRLDEHSSAVLGYAGCAIADMGEYDRGLRLLERAVELDPSNAQAWVARGTVMLATEEIGRAVSYLEHGIRISPIDARRAFWGAVLAIGLLRLNRLDDALEAARSACRTGNNNHIPRVVLALAATRADRAGEARAAMDDARRLWPDVCGHKMQWLIGQEGAAHLRRHGLLA